MIERKSGRRSEGLCKSTIPLQLKAPIPCSSLLLTCAAVLVLFTSFSTIQAQESKYREGYAKYSDFGVYKHVYPPFNLSRNIEKCVPSANTTCPLFVAVMLSFGSIFNSSGALLGVQIALDQINGDPKILPGYRLHYAVMDSQCERTVALKAFHTHIIHGPTKIGILGSGCSVATEATAELANFYNLTQISCQSSSSELANRKRFPTHFQVLASELNIAFGFYGAVRQFGWRRISIIVQNENIFTLMVAKLKKLLGFSLDIRESRFDTVDGTDILGMDPFDTDVRVFMLVMYPIYARDLVCKAALQGLHYPYSMFMFLGWYDADWWVGSEEEQVLLEKKYEGCTVKARFEVVKFSLAPLSGYHTSDSFNTTDSGTDGTQLMRLSQEYGKGSLIGLQPRIYYQTCYDATWIFATALNRTLFDVNSNSNLTAELTTYNEELIKGEKFGLEDFTYNNSALKDVLFHNLEQTDYKGIVGSVKFDANGSRLVFRVGLEQFRPVGDHLEKVLVASILKNVTNERHTTFHFDPGESTKTLFPYGVIFDGIPHEVTVTVMTELTGLFVCLCAIGIALAMVGMTLHLVLRNKVVVRLSSPKLNFLVCIGAIILYLSIIVVVIPTTSPKIVNITCNLTPWLTATGYSLCFGTILVKMARVYFIFDRPLRRTKKPLHDWVLIAAVMVLVFIDIIILISFTIYEEVGHHAQFMRKPNKEKLESTTGEIAEVTLYFALICFDKGRGITLAVLYGYKMILQIVALIFAFSIRKVKIKGLNDAKFIGAAVYVTSIVTAITIVITYTLGEYINIYAAVFSTGFFIGTTSILGLVMIPPIIGHYQDPLGTKIFDMQLGLETDREERSRVSCRRKSLQSLTSKNSSVIMKNDKDMKDRIKELEKKLSKPRVSELSLESFRPDSEKGKERKRRDSNKETSFKNGGAVAHGMRKASQLSVSTAMWGELSSDNNTLEEREPVAAVVPNHVIEQDCTSSEVLDTSLEVSKNSN